MRFWRVYVCGMHTFLADRGASFPPYGASAGAGCGRRSISCCSRQVTAGLLLASMKGQHTAECRNDAAASLQPKEVAQQCRVEASLKLKAGSCTCTCCQPLNVTCCRLISLVRPLMAEVWWARHLFKGCLGMVKPPATVPLCASEDCLWCVRAHSVRAPPSCYHACNRRGCQSVQASFQIC
jgi:hypothetical protein